MKELRYLNKYFWKYRWRFGSGVLFVVISNFFALKPAQYVRDSFDLIKRSLESGHGLESVVFQKQILWYGLLIISMALLRGAFMFFMRQTIIVMSRFIEYDLKNEIYAHYQSLSFSFYRKNNTGDLMARISEDVNKVRSYLGPAIMYGINMVVLFSLTIFQMISVNPKLTFYVLLPLPILSFLIYKVNAVVEQKSGKIQKNLSGMSVRVQEAFSGIRVLKSVAQEDVVIEQFNQSAEEYRQSTLALAKVNAFFQPLIIGLIGLSTLLMIYLGGIEVAKGTLTTGNIAEFVIYINMLAWPVTSLGWTISLIQTAEASQKRINEFLQNQNVVRSEKKLRTPIRGKIEFKNVSLRYPESERWVFQNLSFVIEAGQPVGIKGSIGTGKTTLANLICRMIEPTEGQILIDDVPIEDYDPQYIRSKIGYVSQDVFLFSDSISNNIAFGLDNASQTQIEQVSVWADLDHNVKHFPKGYETLIGERGITLSGGQKQRVSIARALIKDAPILLFDDCLSAVDTQTEHQILSNIFNLPQKKTILFISHRESSFKKTDFVLDLDKYEN